jgi:hypothetical protein
LSGILNIGDGSVKDSHQEQDNARPHVAARTMDTIQKLKWNLLPHPQYSPYLASSDYHLFGPLKEKGFAIMRKLYRMFKSGYTGNEKTSS